MTVETSSGLVGVVRTEVEHSILIGNSERGVSPNRRFRYGPSRKLRFFAVPPLKMTGHRDRVFRFSVLGLCMSVVVALTGCGNDPGPTLPLTTVVSPTPVETGTESSPTSGVAPADSSTVAVSSSVPDETSVSTTRATTTSLASSDSSSVSVVSTTSPPPPPTTSLPPPPTTSLPPPPTTAGETDPAPSMEGMFVSVIVSATSEAEARAALTDLEDRFDGEFGILLSDDFASLNPGYWVV